MMKMKRIAFFRMGIRHQLPDAPNANAIGANVAGWGMIQSLIQYGEWDVIHFVCAGNPNHPYVKQSLDSINIMDRNRSDVQIEIIPWGIFFDNLKNNFYSCVYFSYLSFQKFAYKVRQKYPEIDTIFLGHIHATHGIDMQEDFVHNIIFPLEKEDAIICSSNQVKEFFVKKHRIISDSIYSLTGERIRFQANLPVVPFGVDVNKYKSRNKHEMRMELDLPQDALLILWMGRFSIRSKADLFPLLYAFNKMKEDIGGSSAVKLLIAGADQEGYASELVRQGETLDLLDDVIFRFNISDLSQRMLYSASDIFVTIADYLGESFGLTVIEAMASGLPVVASDWNGYRDAIINGKNGFLIDTYWSDCVDDIIDAYTKNDNLYPLRLSQSMAADVNQLHEKLMLLLADKDLRTQMSKNAVHHVCDHYSIANIAKKVFNLIDESYVLRLRRKSRKSAKTPINIKKLQDLFTRDYFKEYAHYPSCVLAKDQQITFTKFGLEIVSDLNTFRNLTPSLFSEFLNTLAIKDLIENGLQGSVEEVSRFMQENYSLEANEAMRHILWMCKYGIIQIE